MTLIDMISKFRLHLDIYSTFMWLDYLPGDHTLADFEYTSSAVSHAVIDAGTMDSQFEECM